MPSLTIVLQPNEFDALQAMAQRESRKARHQATVILRDLRVDDICYSVCVGCRRITTIEVR